MSNPPTMTRLTNLMEQTLIDELAISFRLAYRHRAYNACLCLAEDDLEAILKGLNIGTESLKVVSSFDNLKMRLLEQLRY